MPNPFPALSLKTEKKGEEDFNPAIQLFGRRFFADQTVQELLIEFLLVATSPKRIGKRNVPNEALLLPAEILDEWPEDWPLRYAPKARLNLKLFSFLGASRLDTRHDSHRQHYRNLVNELRSTQRLSSGTLPVEEVLKTLENLFLGFQGVGRGRTWCAANFVPITRELIACESIWKASKGSSIKAAQWDNALGLFSHTQHLFMARGGELLYLQMCNALRQEESTIQCWARDTGLSLSPRESSPAKLHAALETAIASALSACPRNVGALAEYLDTGIESDTAKRTDCRSGSNELRFVDCGWCPEESWPEGMLFSVELLRICEAVIDPIERLELLEIACAMQVLRSLCTQSMRNIPGKNQKTVLRGGVPYRWALSDPAGDHEAVKQISRQNVTAIQRLIRDAVRNPEIQALYAHVEDTEQERIYQEADRGYGYKLFLSLAKRIGLIVPRKGAGARFVLNDRILRFLVLALLRPGERMTYDSFKELLLSHYGIAVDDAGLALACEWSGRTPLTSLGGRSDAWLIGMLTAAGALIPLSDSCALVSNSFGGEEAIV